MTFLHWKNYTTHCILLKQTFETPLCFLKDICKQTAVFDYYKYGLRTSRETFKKEVLCCDQIFC